MNDAFENESETNPPACRTLPTFQEFTEQIRRHLTRVPQGAINSLLELLYKAAQSKVELEELRDLAPSNLTENREGAKRLNKARVLLKESLTQLKEARQTYPVELQMIEDWYDEPQTGRFAQIAQALQESLDVIDELVAAYYVLIHPQLRKGQQKRLAQELSSEYTVDLFPEYPARPDSPDIDHWFIHTAKECLDRYRAPGGERIARYDQVIAEIFKVAFRDPLKKARDEENIRTELRRPAPPDYLGLKKKLFAENTPDTDSTGTSAA